MVWELNNRKVLTFIEGVEKMYGQLSDKIPILKQLELVKEQFIKVAREKKVFYTYYERDKERVKWYSTFLEELDNYEPQDLQHFVNFVSTSSIGELYDNDDQICCFLLTLLVDGLLEKMLDFFL